MFIWKCFLQVHNIVSPLVGALCRDLLSRAIDTQTSVAVAGCVHLYVDKGNCGGGWQQRVLRHQLVREKIELWPMSLCLTTCRSSSVLPRARMDTTEQCNAVISHFNGKFIKMAPGALGRKLWTGAGWVWGGLLVNLMVTKLVMINCWVTSSKMLRCEKKCFFFSYFFHFSLQLPPSRCCANSQTAKGRNTLTVDLFPMDKRAISD